MNIIENVFIIIMMLLNKFACYSETAENHLSKFIKIIISKEFTNDILELKLSELHIIDCTYDSMLIYCYGHYWLKLLKIMPYDLFQ